MNIPNEILNYNRKFCIHEAGHYIVALELGFRCTCINYTIYDEKTHKGEVGINLNVSLKELKDVAKYCRNRIVVLNSGAVAQSFGENNIVNENGIDKCFRSNGSDDYAKIREHLRLIGSIEKPDLDDRERTLYIEALNKELVNESISLVTKHISSIKYLGNIILDSIKEYNVPSNVNNETISNLDFIKAIITKK